MGDCCSLEANNDDFPMISAAEEMLDTLSLKEKPKESHVSIQGPNPLTFQNVTLSDTSSDIDEALIAEMTKSDSDSEEVKVSKHKKSKKNRH